MFDTRKLRQLRAELADRSERSDRDSGFTLIELLVVVVIIGILIAIAIPLYLNYQKGAKDKSSQSDLRAAVSSISQCYTDNGNAYPSAVVFTTANGVTTGVPTGSGNTNPCANDVINLSSGTTMVYTYVTATSSYTLADSNSGGNRNASATTLATASAANAQSAGYYFYDSSVGGSIQ